MMIRSGQLKSQTAHPGVKNTGCDTTVPRSFSCFRRYSTPEAVPTGTGVTSDRIGGRGARRAMRTAKSPRCCAESSAKKMTCALRANDSISVEYANRPARTFRLMTSAKFFSKKGTLPCAISTMRELSGWQQVTGVPKSARHAEITVPRYPAPYTPICIMPPAAKMLAQGKLPQSFIYAANFSLGRVRKGRVRQEKVQ